MRAVVQAHSSLKGCRRTTSLLAALSATVMMFGLASTGLAQTGCEKTADAMLKSCVAEVWEEGWSKAAVCHNEDSLEQGPCFNEAALEREEALEECGDIHEARLDLCDSLGEDRYDPDFDEEDFETEFNNLNAYFPLKVGNRWVLEAEDETITIEVLDRTKLIDDVTCIVVNDFVDGETESEDTDDWYGQASNGDVHYCGELSRDFEIIEGDSPPIPELVAIDGSFKADRDGAESGILMFAAPQVGQFYRQEWALGEAEDAAEILSNDYSFGDDPDLDEFAPQALVELLCNSDCVVTLDFTPHDPGIIEYKYYAPGIGLFLEVKPEDGEIAQLVECNLGGACDLLP